MLKKIIENNLSNSEGRNTQGRGILAVKVNGAALAAAAAIVRLDSIEYIATTMNECKLSWQKHV